MVLLKKTSEKNKELFATIDAAYRMDETQCLNFLLAQLNFSEMLEEKTKKLAQQLVESVRQNEAEKGGMEALMTYYDLSSEEGIVLMCLAEALLRIPDKETENLLIRDKLTSGDWAKHLGLSESRFVNVATWGLNFTGKVLKKEESAGYFQKIWQGLLRRSGEPFIRQAVREVIKVMSEQFVLGRTIEEALKNSKKLAEKGYIFSYDMLGEVARTQADADRYFAAYQDAIQAVGKTEKVNNFFYRPSVSIKLSALYPRYEFSKYEFAVPYLISCLKTLALQAKEVGIGLTIDAEEADRLEMSLDIFSAVFSDEAFKDWPGLGLAVQAYQKRAYSVLTWLIELAREEKKCIPIRLVKGAYWDSEIKFSQVNGYSGYPVFTRKVSTDINYLACAKLMLSAQDAIYPQFATHNAYSVAAILSMMDDPQQYQFEFQNLQGMGKALHDQIVAMKVPCRVYAPVGRHEDLLPYLVRRLLENGANSSFVNKIADRDTSIDTLIASPLKKLKSYSQIPNPKIPLPQNIFADERVNSLGIDFSHGREMKILSQQLEQAYKNTWTAIPSLVNKNNKNLAWKKVATPTDHRQIIGQYVESRVEDVGLAVNHAKQALERWNALGINKRADILLRMADLLEENRAELMALAIKEAGKTMNNALNEVREATDFCRYYAQQAKAHLTDKVLPGPTGESNMLRMEGRGVMVCISPWNFPIAIFTGQVAAALVAGNCVIAKPAEQTPLVAAKVVDLFYQAGVPENVLQLIIGNGETVGAALVSHSQINGVLFTGSTETAKIIQQTLVKNPTIPLFIAETGGINAMIADSSALPEQLVADVIASAFDSAGQRCSALRVLCIQKDIAEKFMEMLQGAMAEMLVGDPKYLQTDVGPVIDVAAKKMLDAHAEKMQKEARLIYRVNLSEETKTGTFVAPQAYEISSLKQITKEVFGPILHIIQYRSEDLETLLDDLNAWGYGLTFGIQSRINDNIEFIKNKISAGNIYVNRNIIGAVVGVQPFGGHGLSGTGPKAGGPHYLPALCKETTITVNTTAVGGNASLLASEE